MIMSKTIDEASNEYAANWEAKHNIHNPEVYDLIVDAYKASAERMMSLPLAQRLTAEEKGQIKKLYCAAEASKSDYSRGYSDAIKRIFGADFFKEER